MPNAVRAAPSTPHAWLFDFDRTLAILEPEVDWTASRRALEAELLSAGAPPDLLAELIAAHPRGNLALYEALRHHLLDNAAQPADARTIIGRASALIERYEAAGVDQAAPMPGAATMLGGLARRHLPVAIVTSNSSVTVRRWLEINRLGDSVKIIVGRDSMLALKPSPESVFRALDLLGARVTDVAFVGDSIADLQAARAASVRFCAIAPGPAVVDRLTAAGVREIFGSLDELAAHFSLLE